MSAPLSLAGRSSGPKGRHTTLARRLAPKFGDEMWAWEWLHYTLVGPDAAWVYKPSGKTGTSSTLHFLFALEFDTSLTVRVQQEDGLNPEQAAHSLMDAQIFASPLESARPLRLLDSALRLTTVRHPLARAVSGYRYLCASQIKGVGQFAKTRLRLSARTGFDWDRHTGTPDGFLRFLDYLEAEIEDGAGEWLDSHFRPQVLNIRPDLFRPDLVGRTEDLPGFFAEICARLDRPMPAAAQPASNRNTQGPADPALAEAPGARAQVARLFAEDYARFGYDPEDPLSGASGRAEPEAEPGAAPEPNATAADLSAETAG